MKYLYCPITSVDINSFIVNNIPVLAKNSYINNNAYKKWDANYILNKCYNKTVEMQITNKQRNNKLIYTQKNLKIEDAFQQIRKNNSLNKKYYIANQPIFDSLTERQDEDILFELKDDIFIPPFLNNKKYRIGFWFGEEGNITPLHFDFYHSILVQLRGHKRVLLFPPNQTELLYPGYDSNNSVWFHVSDISFDLERDVKHKDFPLFKKANVIICELFPGDTLIIPCGWWHYVTSITESYSLNFFFKSSLEHTSPSNILKKTVFSLLKKNKIEEIFDIFDVSEHNNILSIIKILHKNRELWVSIALIEYFLRKNEEINNKEFIKLMDKYQIKKDRDFLFSRALKEDNTKLSYKKVKNFIDTVENLTKNYDCFCPIIINA